MTERQLSANEVLGLGEAQVVEFKQSGSLMKEAFSDLCGMINANPAKGMVVFGVSPTGAIVGLGSTNLDSFQQTLANHASQKIDPPLQLEIEPADCEGSIVVLVTARRHRGTPYHEYDGRAWIREGSATRQLAFSEKQQLTRTCNRDLHNGPWVCDRCGALAGQVSGVAVTATGPRKVYTHSCGGEWWPAAS